MSVARAPGVRSDGDEGVDHPEAGPRRRRFGLPTQANASGIVGVIGVAALLLWVGSNGYRESLLILGCLYALVALGMYVPFVLIGTLSMAYSAYAAIGGYAVAVFVAKQGWPLWVGWFVAPFVSAILAVILGLATRRLSGFYLVAVTLLFAEAFTSWVQSNSSLAGGESGYTSLASLSLFGWKPTVVQFGVGAAGLVCVVAFLIDRLRLSPWGVLVRSLREVPHAVEAAGLPVNRMRLVALAIGAGVGSLGGSLFVSSVHAVNPSTFTINLVFVAVFMPIIGGVGTSWGSVLGAAIVTELTLNFHAVGQSGSLAVALGVLVILLIAPRGIAGYIDTLRKLVVRAATGRRSGHE